VPITEENNLGRGRQMKFMPFGRRRGKKVASFVEGVGLEENTLPVAGAKSGAGQGR